MPTETVYGLAADARSAAAVSEIYRLKGRPLNHPVIVHLGDRSWVERWGHSIPAWADDLMARFWPGPLTVIVPRRPEVGDWLTGGQDTVGLRIPQHPLALQLIMAFGDGLAAPSANRFGRVSPTTAQHVEQEFQEFKCLGSPLLVLDGGPCQVGLESTIVDATGQAPRILRPGSLGPHIGALDCWRGPQAPTPVVPGSLSSHYQPAVPCHLWDGQPLHPGDFLVHFGESSDSDGNRVALGQDPELAARSLYSTLRRLELQAQRILIQPPPPGPNWQAIADRIRRATAAPLDP